VWCYLGSAGAAISAWLSQRGFQQRGLKFPKISLKDYLVMTVELGQRT